MRIFVIGQAAFGQDVFNRLRDAGEEVVAVASPAQSLSGRPDRLRAVADSAGVAAFETSKLRDADVQQPITEAHLSLTSSFLAFSAKVGQSLAPSS